MGLSGWLTAAADTPGAESCLSSLLARPLPLAFQLSEHPSTAVPQVYGPPRHCQEPQEHRPLA